MDDYLREVIRVSKAVPIFPVRLVPKKLKGGKVKIRKIPACPNGFLDATHDEAQIRAWWKENPNAAVGMPTGRESGLWVLDLDVKDNVNGADHFKDKDMPDTIMQTTVSGGQHMFFAHSYKNKFRSSTDVMGMRCVDTRTNGGYVVIAPSKGYVMNKPLTEDAAMAPDWLRDDLNASYSSKKSTTPVPSGRVFGEVEVAKLLRDCPIANYRDRSAWLQIIMAVKSGTGGESYGLEALHEWSDQEGEDYDAEVLDREWKSLDISRDGGITGKTLVHQAKVHRVERAVMEDTSDDFLEVSGNDAWTFSNYLLESSDINAMNLLTEPEIIAREGMDPTANPFFGLMVFDELKQAVVFTRRPPGKWGSDKRVNYTGRRVDLEHDLTEMRVLINSKYGTKFSTAKFNGAVTAATYRNKQNPVTGYLDSLKWDGTSRIETWLIKHAGATDTEYVRFVSKKVLLSGVYRAYRAGWKVDNMLVLESDQGVGKSTIVQILGGDWAGVPTISVGDKDAEQNLQGIWVAEWSELANMRKKEAGQLKDFISKAVATFRGTYAKSATEFPRRCIIIGTHNPACDGQYLTDETGNRRYWPVKIEGVIKDEDSMLVDFNGLTADRDQLWAEAVHLFNNGEKLDLTGKQKALAKIEQDKRMVADPWADIIVTAVMSGAMSTEAKISYADLYALLEIPISRVSNYDKQRIRLVFDKCLQDTFTLKAIRFGEYVERGFARDGWAV